MKKYIKKIIIGGVVLFVAFFLWQRFGSGKSAEQFESYAVIKGAVAETVSDSGEIEPVHYANLSFEVPTIITWVDVAVGDRVEKGQELVRIDRNQLSSQIHAARVDLEKAIANEENARRKWDEYNPEERHNIKKDVERARATLASVQSQWSKTKLVSPIDGVVARQDARIGEVATGTVIRVIDPSDLHIEAFMSESDITEMFVGQDAEITFDAFDDEVFGAKITQIDPEAVELQDVTYYRIVLDLDQKIERVRSGMSVDVDIVVAEESDVLILPLRFVRTDDDGSYVYVREGEKHVKKYIELGIEGDDGNVEVVRGITEGVEVFAIYEEKDE